MASEARSEYRVVGFADGGASLEYSREAAEKFAAHASRHGYSKVRVQTRTVVEATLWVDLSEEPHTDE